MLFLSNIKQTSSVCGPQICVCCELNKWTDDDDAVDAFTIWTNPKRIKINAVVSHMHELAPIGSVIHNLPQAMHFVLSILRLCVKTNSDAEQIQYECWIFNKNHRWIWYLGICWCCYCCFCRCFCSVYVRTVMAIIARHIQYICLYFHAVSLTICRAQTQTHTHTLIRTVLCSRHFITIA